MFINISNCKSGLRVFNDFYDVGPFISKVIFILCILSNGLYIFCRAIYRSVIVGLISLQF